MIRHNRLMEYIPKEYKKDVVDIRTGNKVWNETTKKWNITIIVEWNDGETNEYQNASYMRFKLKEIGRD